MRSATTHVGSHTTQTPTLKDPLEDFDYSDPRYNPTLRPAAARTPSHHCTSARKLRASNSLPYCLNEKGYIHFFNVSV
ncbi:glutamate receptor 3.6-like [Dorcoceras hygrometricum]|uniref:Glutamate receptor 3.6-like n=1 Tax=Dorcoceras hygrometricum TaxID=472368 RepID=A0A2Z7CP36_9LAMI|nr:glutamate receptor 3.6-like [Dorcoceras hygrometricum]